MKRWMTEDWEFEIAGARDCRPGFEEGDRFIFQYGCPAGFCPRTMAEIYTWCEVIRCGGDFTYRGAAVKNMIWI